MLQKAVQKGFTLIELLVVITIIGILATGATTVYTSQIQKARDTTRVSDTKALQSAIEQFYQDDTAYPQGGEDWIGTTGSAVTDYAPTLAQDPKHDQTCNASRCGYVYNVGADSLGIQQGSYEISTAFENEGNRSSKASSTSDDGDDDNRLEVGVDVGSRDTVSVQEAEFAGAAIGAADTAATTMVIMKSAVVTK